MSNPLRQWLVGQKEQQQEIFSNPEKAKELSFGKVSAVLDHLEEKLNEGDFLCGPSYTLADAVFTCLLARFSLLAPHCYLISVSKVGDDPLAG